MEFREPVSLINNTAGRLLLRLIAAALLVGGSVAVHAQQAGKVHRIGFLHPSSSAHVPIEAFRQGLASAGYVEARNIVLEVRFAGGQADRLPALAAELLDLKVDVILAGSTPGAIAAKKATSTVPIVFAGVTDPVGSGIVASLARPGGNITGVTVAAGGAGLTGKSVELLKETAPALSHLAVLLNPTNPLSAGVRAEIQAPARALSLKVDLIDAANDKDLDEALAAIAASKAQGIFVAPDPFLTRNAGKIAQFATSRRLPAIQFSRQFADAGGLMSYGGSLTDSYRAAARHVDRILNGAKPADLPVEQPTRFELVINMKTARAIGLKIPQLILLRTDHLIE